MKQLKVLFESLIYLVVIYLFQMTAKYLYIYTVFGIANNEKLGIYHWVTNLMGFNGMVTDFIYETRIVYILVGWIFGIITILWISAEVIEPIWGRKIFSKNTVVNTLLSIVIGLSLVLMINSVANGLSEIFVLPTFYVKNELTLGVNIGFNIVVIGILIPIFEEVLFRWILLNRFNKIMSIIPAIILQSLLFSVFHLNLLQGIYVFVLGVVCGYSVAKTKVIHNAIIIHMVFNTTNLYLYYIADVEMVIGQLILVLVAGITLLIFGISNLKYIKKGD